MNMLQLMPKSAVHTLNEADTLRLKRQATFLEQEIEGPEEQILQFEQAKPEAHEKANEEAESHQEVINLTLIFVERFNREELRIFCFHLDVDYDDLPAEGKANKARELTKYLRHNRIEESIILGKSLRPDIDWDRLITA